MAFPRLEHFAGVDVQTVEPGKTPLLPGNRPATSHLAPIAEALNHEFGRHLSED
jgi:hypothetical protein